MPHALSSREESANDRSEPVTPSDVRQEAIERIARERPPLTDVQRRRIRPYTSAGIPATAVAA